MNVLICYNAYNSKGVLICQGHKFFNLQKFSEENILWAVKMIEEKLDAGIAITSVVKLDV